MINKYTPEQLNEAVARQDSERKESCEKILEKHRQKTEAERRNKLLIPKTKKK